MSILQSQVRADLEAMPPRIAALPVGDNGYPVPWFVAWIDGKPEFRAADSTKTVRAIRERRCWVCGDSLGRWLTFVIGPMCGINRISAEPPSHLECAQWSARNCPFLNGRQSKRRKSEELDEIAAPEVGMMIRRNPGVTALWKCRDFRIVNAPGGILFKIGEPVGGVEWYARGRRATREEVDESVRTGLPALEDAARQDGALGIMALAAAKAKFTALLDAANWGQS